MAVQHVPPPAGGQWQWAAYPGQEPQWYWFPDVPPPAPVAAPTLWDDFRRRSRRVGFLLLVLGFVCSGVLLYDQLGDGLGARQMTLQVEGGAGAGQDDPALDDAALDDPAQDNPAQEDPAGEAVSATGDPVLDELADTLHDRAQAFADATVDGNGDAALEYIEPSCRDRVRGDLTAGIADGAAAYAGVRLAVASVVVTLTDGRVAYRADGTPTDAFSEVEIPSRDVPELWKVVDGHWYRDVPECRAG